MMTWIENLFPPKIQEFLNLTASILEIATVFASMVLLIWRYLLYGNTGIGLIDNYITRKSLKEMARSNTTIQQFRDDPLFLTARATEGICWIIGMVGTFIILRMIGYPANSLNTYIRIVEAPSEHRDALTHILMAWVFICLVANRLEPIVMLSNPRLLQRRARRARELLERARLSTEEKEEFRRRIGLT